MTDFIAAYQAEIEAALDEQSKAVLAAQTRFNNRCGAAEIVLISAMTHRGRLYVEGPPEETKPEEPAFIAARVVGNTWVSGDEAVRVAEEIDWKAATEQAARDAPDLKALNKLLEGK